VQLPVTVPLIKFLTDTIRDADVIGDNDFHVALEVNLSMRRSIGTTPGAEHVTNDPRASEVVMNEEDIRRTYPWDYKELLERARTRYSDFKVDANFHTLRRQLMTDQRYVRTRLLDPGNPRSSKKDFYNPNIMNELDQNYARRV
jgi:hypothetical protein